MPSNSNRVNGVLLCEDMQTNLFFKQFFRKKKPNWLIHSDPKFTYPQRNQDSNRKWSENSKPETLGRTYVQNHISSNVKSFRRNVTRFPQTFLLIVIDADNDSIEDMVNDLQKRLRQSEHKLEPIKDSERIILLIPKREIETWIEYGRQKTVDEVTAYPKFGRGKETQCYPMVDYLASLYPTLPDDAPPSLQRAYRELAKIL